MEEEMDGGDQLAAGALDPEDEPEVKTSEELKKELQLKAKRLNTATGKFVPVFDTRQQALRRNALPVIDLKQLNDDHIELYNQTLSLIHI